MSKNVTKVHKFDKVKTPLCTLQYSVLCLSCCNLFLLLASCQWTYIFHSFWWIWSKTHFRVFSVLFLV